MDMQEYFVLLPAMLTLGLFWGSVRSVARLMCSC